MSQRAGAKSLLEGSQDYYDRFLSDDYPELGNEPISTEAYCSAEYFEKVKENVYSDAWFAVGHSCELPNVGDYMVKEIPVFNARIIVVRGDDGEIRSFYNICTHRSNELIYGCKNGNTKGFICPFHSWTFDLKGNLRGVPERDRFQNLDEKERGLALVSTEVWNGLIFINKAKEPEKNLKAYLGGWAENYQDYPLEELYLGAAWEVDLEANWKVIVDAFSEGYHIASIHKNVAPDMYTTGSNGYARMGAFKAYGEHMSMVAQQNPTFVPSPIEGLARQLAGPSFMRGIQEGEMCWRGLNPSGHPPQSWAFDVNVIFPSTFIDLSQGFAFTYEIYPIAHNKVRFSVKNFFVKPQTWSERIGQEFMAVQLREALHEDLTTMEAVQSGLSSGVVKDLMLSDQEIGLRFHHSILDAKVRG